MANRELIIAFIYDTQRCTHEADDPQEAVLFFHPGWVSEQHRLALCGQLMGATYFLLATFSCPRVMSLQSGKFAIRTFGRYVMAIGTDRNIPEWILEQRAETMTSLLQLYFGGLENLANQCDVKSDIKNSVASFIERLGRIFETFLPIVQYAGQILGNVPTIRLPKSASNVFLEAMQILRCCQEQTGVIGGTILYQNKVVASQMSAELTKHMVISDPYRIKSPGTFVETTFHLPLGAQLLRVFVMRRELCILRKDAEHVRNTFTQVDSAPKVVNKQTRDHNISTTRDKSKIFTVMEEIDGEIDSPASEVVKTETSIPICSLNTISCIPESDLEDVRPPLESRLVCSTPLRDLNISKVLHGQALSIFGRGEGVTKPISPKIADVAHNNQLSGKSSIPDVVREAEAARRGRNMKDVEAKADKLSNKVIQDVNKFLVGEPPTLSTSASLPSINTNNVPMKFYSLGLPPPTVDQCSPVTQSRPHRYFYNTITDPCFPVFRQDGLPLSRALFDEHLENHYKSLDTKPARSREAKSSNLRREKQIVECSVENKATVEAKQPNKRPASLSLKTASNVSTQGASSSTDPIRPTTLSIGDNRSARNQPVHSTSLMESRKDSNSEQEDRKRAAQQALPPVARPTSLSGGLPLTPLMAKLSHLAMDRHGTPGIEMTPCEPREPFISNRVETPMAPKTLPFQRKSISDADEGADDSSEEVVLLVCGVQSMTLLLLLEPNQATNPSLLTTVWELGTSSVERLELLLHHSLDHCPASTNSGADSYSFLCLDPAWDAVQRGGAWSGPELELVGSLHRDFRNNPNLTEMCIRIHDNVMYGYQCGQTQVFYQQQQPGQISVGLPTPADLMGTVPLTARRRLERDHGIVLL